MSKILCSFLAYCNTFNLIIIYPFWLGTGSDLVRLTLFFIFAKNFFFEPFLEEAFDDAAEDALEDGFISSLVFARLSLTTPKLLNFEGVLNYVEYNIMLLIFNTSIYLLNTH